MSRTVILAYRLFALIELVIAGLSAGFGSWWGAFPALTMAYLFWMWPAHDGRSFRHGWRQGRIELMEAAHEARARGLDPYHFIVAELERTALSDEVQRRD